MSKDRSNQNAPEYGCPIQESSQPTESQEDFGLSDLFLDKFWVLTAIASLAISLFNAKQLYGFVMFMGFLLGTFLGLVGLPAILASILALIPALIISRVRRDKPFKNAFKPIFTLLLFLLWLLSIVGWIINLSTSRR
jgi:hypothetical protein